MDAQLEPTGTHALWDETFQKLGPICPASEGLVHIPSTIQRRLAEL